MTQKGRLKQNVCALFTQTWKKHLRLLASACLLKWTSLGLNQGPPDYEYLKVIFYDISLFWKCTEYQRFTKMRFSMNIKKHP